MQSQAVQTSRAADIPEELFEHILWYACSIGGGRSKTGLKKSVAASVALVCRYWARLARAELFCQITLRNLADVTRFSAILAAAPPAHLEPVAGLLLTLVAAPDQRDVPWLHRVFLHVYPQLPRVPSFRIEALPSDGRPWRSLHPALPRALPGSTMPLDRLVLADVRFTNGRMLARLLASLPLLPYASLHRATFDVAPVREDFYKPPFGLQLCWFTTDSHAACLALVPSLLAHLTERGPAPKLRGGRAAKYVLDAGDLEILDELLSLFSGASAFAIHHGLGQKLTKEQDMQCMPSSTSRKACGG
ncbi:hypothetical protein PsYK624_056320 [Phanerochaete sordida]|uniref:F-box domain-containing protein n=1 Tax=Phanerochaete sordida TaxID=48140 RepID=A0A9P3LBT3_9APHY|nr:hypothetical protein PsYK624_056320 [Phanerochaete sordida]